MSPPSDSEGRTGYIPRGGSMRYAIYFMPRPDTPIWRFGSSVIGYDALSGEEIEPPDDPICHEEGVKAWMAEPRRYGFHATLKAPFELAKGASEAGLIDYARAFAAGHSPVILPALTVAEIGRFIALIPAQPSQALSELAAACVRGFEPLRAPLSEADRERRLASSLTERQIANLERWGYPHVCEDFRFHMTLTGPVEKETRLRLLNGLARLYETVAAPLLIDALTIAYQPSRESRFKVLARCPFRSGPEWHVRA